MITENVSTLKIHKLSQEQYDRALEAGNIDPNAIYLTPDDGNDSGIYVGPGEMPDGYNVQIDPDGKAILVPTKVSDLENDAGYITAENMPDTKIEGITNGTGDSSLVFMSDEPNNASGKYAVSLGTDDTSALGDLESLATGRIEAVAPVANGNLSIAGGLSTRAESVGTISVGVASTAGIFGYYWNSITQGTTSSVVTLSKKQKSLDPVANDDNFDWQPGDYISIVNGQKYAFVGTITNIATSDNTVALTIDTIKFGPNAYTGILDALTMTPDDKTIFAVKRTQDSTTLAHSIIPRGGTVELAWGAACFGLNNLDAGTFGFVAGTNNTLAGDFGAVFGRDNLGAYGNLISGGWNESTGLHSGLIGRDLTNDGNYNLLANRNNKVESGVCHIVGGYGNTVKGGESSGVFGEGQSVEGNYDLVSGKYNTVTGERDTVHGANNTVKGTGNFVSSTQSTVNGTLDAVFGYNHVVSNTESSAVFGEGNTIENGNYNFIGNYKNKVINGAKNTLHGEQNVVESGERNTLVGTKNTVKSGKNNFMTASEATLNGECNGVFGYNHPMLNGDMNLVDGHHHTLGDVETGKAVHYSRVSGQGHIVSPTTNDTIIRYNDVAGFGHVIKHSGVHASGYGHESSADYQTLLGYQSTPDADAALIVGNYGNVLTVGKNGTRSDVGTDAVTVDYLNSIVDRIAELEAKLATMTTELWTFTTETGETVTKGVFLGPVPPTTVKIYRNNYSRVYLVKTLNTTSSAPTLYYTMSDNEFNAIIRLSDQEYKFNESGVNTISVTDVPPNSGDEYTMDEFNSMEFLYGYDHNDTNISLTQGTTYHLIMDEP